MDALLERLETRGIELTDDCSRAIEEEISYTNTQLGLGGRRTRCSSS